MERRKANSRWMGSLKKIRLPSKAFQADVDVPDFLPAPPLFTYHVASTEYPVLFFLFTIGRYQRIVKQGVDCGGGSLLLFLATTCTVLY
jgi:hypothetical protein